MQRPYFDYATASTLSAWALFGASLLAAAL